MFFIYLVVHLVVGMSILFFQSLLLMASQYYLFFSMYRSYFFNIYLLSRSDSYSLLSKVVLVVDLISVVGVFVQLSFFYRLSHSLSLTPSSLSFFSWTSKIYTFTSMVHWWNIKGPEANLGFPPFLFRTCASSDVFISTIKIGSLYDYTCFRSKFGILLTKL